MRKVRRTKMARVAWEANSIRALRQHLGLTQQQLSDDLGVRQQTVSEWETGVYRPRGSSATLLTIVAEEAGFDYHAADDGAHEAAWQDGADDPD